MTIGSASLPGGFIMSYDAAFSAPKAAEPSAISAPAANAPVVFLADIVHSPARQSQHRNLFGAAFFLLGDIIIDAPFQHSKRHRAFDKYGVMKRADVKLVAQLCFRLAAQLP